LNGNSLNPSVGFRPWEQFYPKCLIPVGWVEVRNPTFGIGLNPTCLKPDLSFRHKLFSDYSEHGLKEVVFIIGGCRSGKSRQALEMADGYPGDKKMFIATCIPRDEEMKQRVSRHRAERGQIWQTVEAPIHLPQAIAECSRQADALLVDCLTLWISNLLLVKSDDENIHERIQDLIRALDSAVCPVVVVSNEVGTGIVPENKLSRRFRDLVGSTNQAVAGCADRVAWTVAGIPVWIKG
jgi:adenosylcobinamide kinase/adenosylcobinamide-phosphate guanylyltransferase